MDGVELIFLPPYTPQLNPAEVLVAAFKKRLAGRYFPSRDALKSAIVKLAKSGEVRPVKMMDYMLPGRVGTESSWQAFLNGPMACRN